MMLAVHTCKLVFGSRHPNKNSTMASGVYNPSAGESEIMGSIGLAVQLAKPNQFAPDLVRDLTPEVTDG